MPIYLCQDSGQYLVARVQSDLVIFVETVDERMIEWVGEWPESRGKVWGPNV